MLSYFSLFAIDSQGTLQLAFGLVGMHLPAASEEAVTKFSYLLFSVCFWLVSCLGFRAYQPS